MKEIYSDELAPRRRRPWAIIIGLDDEAARERGFWKWPVRVLDPKSGCGTTSLPRTRPSVTNSSGKSNTLSARPSSKAWREEENQ